MSMKVLRVHTHWEAGEAYSLLELIDALREAIVAHYGDDIALMLQDRNTGSDEWQLELPFTDAPPF
jgi:hypothetical protein